MGLICTFQDMTHRHSIGGVWGLRQRTPAFQHSCSRSCPNPYPSSSDINSFPISCHDTLNQGSGLVTTSVNARKDSPCDETCLRRLSHFSIVAEPQPQLLSHYAYMRCVSSQVVSPLARTDVKSLGHLSFNGAIEWNFECANFKSPQRLLLPACLYWTSATDVIRCAILRYNSRTCRSLILASMSEIVSA
jgi:hypothetical protein